jgi:hypothetical protein
MEEKMADIQTLSDTAAALLARSKAYRDDYVLPRREITVTVSIPAQSRNVTYAGYVAEAGGAWTSPEAIGWIWWTRTSDETVGSDRRISYSVYNESGDRTRRVLVD